MDDQSLGRRIKRLREQRRLTQEQLGVALAVSTKTVSNWESGRNSPRASLGALNAYFGVDLEVTELVTADPVEVALRNSSLDEWRQDAVLSHYKRNLQEQRSEMSPEEQGREIGLRVAAKYAESKGRAQRDQQDKDAEAGGA